MVNKNLIKLGDCTSTIKGYAFKSQWYSSEGRPLVKVSNFSDNSIDTSNLVFIPEKIAKEYEKYSLMRDDVIIQTVGSYASNPASVVGKVIRVPFSASGSLLNQNAVKIIPNPEIEKKFLYYLLKNDTFKNYILGTARGAANQASITLESIIHFKFYLPPFPTQQKIATILYAYDDLIENNARRIKILEEMAQALYREWFVHFRFPGHEGMQMVKSDLGLVPEGWEVRTVWKTFEISGGGTPSTKIPEYWKSGAINWYSPTDLTSSETMFMDCSGNQISELGLKKSSAKLFPPFSVMMTSRATLGVISINTTDACTNQGFITCLPNDRFPLYTLYHWLKENAETFISLGTGSTFKEITKGAFKTIQLIVPPSKIVSQFEKTMQPLALQILNFQRKNANLRRTRDLLLPKLISGELDVSGLNIDIPADL